MRAHRRPPVGDRVERLALFDRKGRVPSPVGTEEGVARGCLDYLEQVVNALRQQTLPSEAWELLVIDNASTRPLVEILDLSWHPRGRIIREEELGLTTARVRGIRESAGDLLVFVDDDNVLAKDYLSAAISCAENSPHIGAFGGSITGQFEVPLPEWISPYLGGLVICELSRDYWANLINWSLAVPYGAGLCVLNIVGEDYARKVDSSPSRKTLGHNGLAVAAGEDTDLAFCAVDLGLGTARFSKLKLTHLIPRARLTREYIVRQQAGFAAAWVILDSLRGDDGGPREEGWLQAILWVPRLLARSPIERRILVASRKARAEARRFVAGQRHA